MRRPCQIAGYAIVSGDGMLADADGVMPKSLQFEADARFFERGLDAADLIVHGRHSQEQQKRAPLRRRLILTQRIPAIGPHPSNPKALLWNPLGATFEQVLAAVGDPVRRIAVIGGPDVFGLFLDRYDVFHLTRAPGVRLPGGVPVFPDVPRRTPEAVLAVHGMHPGPRQLLDPVNNIAVVSWKRVDKP
jgi:dihydrofolate reductase